MIGDHGSRAQELSALGSRHRLPDYASIIWAFVLENPYTRISQLFSAKSVDLAPKANRQNPVMTSADESFDVETRRQATGQEATSARWGKMGQ